MNTPGPSNKSSNKGTTTQKTITLDNSNTNIYTVVFSNSTSNSGTITGSGISLLTSISIIQSSCVLGNSVVTSGQQIKAYNSSSVEYNQTCSSIQRNCKDSVLDGDINYSYDTCNPKEPLNCAQVDYNGYTIPPLNHTQTNPTITKTITGGQADISATCTNGTLAYGQENINCSTNYVLQGGSCVPDTCTGSAPEFSIANGTQKYGISWLHSTTPKDCSYICQAGYYNNSNLCIPASIGNIVSTEGLSTQTPCSDNSTFQDTTGQTSCKTVQSGYYSTPIGTSPKTGETQCEANNYCVNGVKTACPVNYSSPAGSTNVSACTPNSCTAPWGATVNSGNNITAYSSSSATSPTMCISETRTCTAGILSGTYTNQSCNQLYRTCNLPWGGSIAHLATTTAYSVANPVYPTICASQTRTCNDSVLSGTYTNQSCTQNYTYSRNVGAWGTCSLTCGGGTQTRSVTCLRNDGTNVSETFCNAKPAVSQSCNTQSCSYPGCTTSDITLTNGQTWSACNVGTNTAGFTSTSYGSYYQWGRNDTGFTLSRTTDNWGAGGQGPCALGYHVPTQTQWTAAALAITGKSSGWLTSDQTLIQTKLILPMAGRHLRNNTWGYQGTMGMYWSSSLQSATTSYYLFNFTPGTIGAILANAMPVRCIKN